MTPHNSKRIWKISNKPRSKDFASKSKSKLFKNMKKRLMDSPYSTRNANWSKRFKSMKTRSKLSTHILIKSNTMPWKRRWTRRTWSCKSWCSQMSPIRWDSLSNKQVQPKKGRRNWKSSNSSRCSLKSRSLLQFQNPVSSGKNWKSTRTDKKDCREPRTWIECSWEISEIKSSKRSRKLNWTWWCPWMRWGSEKQRWKSCKPKLYRMVHLKRPAMMPRLPPSWLLRSRRLLMTWRIWQQSRSSPRSRRIN